jgi:protocatechuate 3,4-dioxygenase alpha subunit
MTRLPDAPGPDDLVPTAGQTIGPFFHYGTEYGRMTELVRPYSPGSVLLAGSVIDGLGDPVPDALVEIWQADADGTVPTAGGALQRDDLRFSGFGRSATDGSGRYHFWTREPGAVGGAAAFFAVVVFSRGLLERLHTRIYVPGDEQALAADPLLASLSPDERATLVARREGDGRLEHDIRLQGDDETVFLAF